MVFQNVGLELMGITRDSIELKLKERMGWIKAGIQKVEEKVIKLTRDETLDKLKSESSKFKGEERLQELV